MHDIRLDILEYPCIMRNKHNTEPCIFLCPVHTFRNDTEGINIKPRIRFIHNSKFRLQEFKLEDFCPLFFAAGKTFIDRTLSEFRIHPQVFHGSSQILCPLPDSRCLAVNSGFGSPQEIGHRDPRYLHRILHGQEQPGHCPLIRRHFQQVPAVKQRLPAVHNIFWMPGEGIGQS